MAAITEFLRLGTLYQQVIYNDPSGGCQVQDQEPHLGPFCCLGTWQRHHLMRRNKRGLNSLLQQPHSHFHEPILDTDINPFVRAQSSCTNHLLKTLPPNTVVLKGKFPARELLFTSCYTVPRCLFPNHFQHSHFNSFALNFFSILNNFFPSEELRKLLLKRLWSNVTF